MIDLTNKKFNRLTVIKYSSRIQKWKCSCNCGKYIYVTSSSLRFNNTKNCGCLNLERLKSTGNLSNAWQGYKEISAKWISKLKSRHKNKNFKFNITLPYLWKLFIKQNRKCALSGLELKFNTSHKECNGNASLDRIDSSKGYIKGNVQWVDKDINKIKREYKNDCFIKLCHLVSNYNK